MHGMLALRRRSRVMDEACLGVAWSDDDASGAGARAPIRVRTPECRRERLVWAPGQSVRVNERLVAVCEQELGEQPCGAVKVLAVGDEQHELTLEFQALNGNDL
jgi:hypothetical protein